MDETNLTVDETQLTDALPKAKDEDFRLFGVNRHTRRRLNKLGIDYKPAPPVKQAVNPEKEFKQFRIEFAQQYGSTTNKLKKKHFNRDLIAKGLRVDKKQRRSR
jgi:hypothetical protein